MLRYLCLYLSLIHTAAKLSIGPDTTSVLIDIGVGSGSELGTLLLNNNLHPTIGWRPFLIALEPHPEYAEAHRSRLAAINDQSLLQAACVEYEDATNVTLLVHDYAECSSLHESTPGHAAHKRGRCIGKPPRRVQVSALTLAHVLQQVPATLRVQILKLDVQGHEWSCLSGALDQLHRVDNIVVETQDVPPGCALYAGSLPNVSTWDKRLGMYGFERQYCEVNTLELAEYNCLFTHSSAQPIWMTGRGLPPGLPPFEFDTSRPPRFMEHGKTDVRFVRNYSDARKGALDDQLRSFGHVIRWAPPYHAKCKGK